jgi:hypothetical protein
MAHSEVSSTSKHFGIDTCEAEYPNDELNFIQIMPFHGSNHIYCPGNQFEIDGRVQKCPESVFLLPMSASFRINDLQYSGSQAVLEHHEMIDPLFTMRANWHLQPSLNLSELRTHPLLNTATTVTVPTSTVDMNHPMTWTTMGMTLLVLLLVIALVIAVCRYETKRQQPVKFSVVARQIGPNVSDGTASIEEIRNQD